MIKIFSYLKPSDVVFILLINVKMPTIFWHLKIMSRKNIMLIELHEKSSISLKPEPSLFAHTMLLVMFFFALSLKSVLLELR